MSSRPFNTSTKTPTSVKLRGLNTSKSVTQQLEMDSRKMEDRLRELKTVMNREKEEREFRGGSNKGIWASGTPGALSTHANEIGKKKKPVAPPLGQTTKPKSGAKARKIKVLKDTPIEVPQRPKFKIGTTFGGDGRVKGLACGQCEQKAVALTCMECGEHYCTGCYARFHMKGALKNHRSIPYKSPSESSSESIQILHENGLSNQKNAAAKPLANGLKSTTGVDGHSHKQDKQEKVVKIILKSPVPTSTGGALLQGDYDEQESAAAFAAALTEWRQGKNIESATEAASSTPRGTSTARTSEGTSTSQGDISKRQIQIKFNETSTLSYADRLLLKKHRRTELSAALLPNLAGTEASKEMKQQENVLKKEEMDIKRSDENTKNLKVLVNGELHFSDAAELEDEHQRYMNIFAKSDSQETSFSDTRPESCVSISEVTEGEDVNLEVSTEYCVQEGPDNKSVTEHTKVRNFHISENQLKSSSTSPKMTTPSPPSSVQDKKKSPEKKPPSRSFSSGNTSGYLPQKTATQPLVQKTMSEQLPFQSQTQTESSSKNLTRETQSTKKSSGQAVNHAAMTKTKNRSSEDTDKLVEAKKCNAVTHDVVMQERPVSGGLTTKPSQDLIQACQHTQQLHHHYKEGLGEFFTAGLTVIESSNLRLSSPRSSVTPTNKLPECLFQGSSVWQPESSLAATPDEAMQLPYTPSPPSSAASRPSSGKRNITRTRQMKTPVKQIARNPETGSPIPEKDICASLHHNQSTGGGNTDQAGVGMALSDSQVSHRSSSCVEVDGMDMTEYDEDVVVKGFEMSTDDLETLEQLTWELASQEGRVTADGRITSISILEDEDENHESFSHDAELGILQDDGHGSGLSTPCEAMMEIRDELSEDELQESQHCKEEVGALR